MLKLLIYSIVCLLPIFAIAEDPQKRSTRAETIDFLSGAKLSEDDLALLGKPVKRELVPATPEILRANRALLSIHQARLQSEIFDLKKKVETTPSASNGHFDPATQLKRVLESKNSSLDEVQKGLKNLEKISSYGTFTDLNQVNLALSGVDPFDKTAANEASRKMGLSYAKATGSAQPTMTMTMTATSFSAFEMPEDKLDPECVKNLKSKNKFKPETILKVCGSTLTEGGYCNCDTSAKGSQSGINGLVRLSKDIEITEALRVENARKEVQKFKAEMKTKQLLKGTFESTQKNPKYAAFMQELGIVKAIPKTKDKNDLSDQFYPPTSQGQTGACAAFATIADMEITGKTPKLSEGSFHGQLAKFNRDYDPKKPDSSISNREYLKWDGAYTETFEDFKKQAVVPESKNGYDAEFLRDYKTSSQYKIEKPVYIDNDVATPINFEMIRTMIDAKKPPVAWIESDKRSNRENWIEIESGGNSRHVLNIVGYGYSGVDPKDGKSKPYFILRDSLGKKDIHTQVDAENLLSNLSRLEKTVAVKAEK